MKVFIALLCLLLIACEKKPPSEKILDTYRTRLSNTLDLSLEPLPEIIPIYYPSRRNLEIELTAQSIDLLEFLELTPCELQRLVGQRNSSLGLFMSHSQQWIYEAEFIRLAKQCVDVLANDDKNQSLRRTLERVLLDKQSQRGAVVWNAVWASVEFQTLMSSGSTAINPNAEKPSELIESLRRLKLTVNNWGERGKPPGQDVEFLYQILGAQKEVGALLESVQLLRVYLDNINVGLIEHLKGRPLCFRQKPNRKSAVLENVFRKFYIGEVQPYIARVHQSASPIVESLSEINAIISNIDASKNLTVEIPSILAFNQYWQSSWSDQHPSQWRMFNFAIEQHTLLWQKQLAQCGLLPSE